MKKLRGILLLGLTLVAATALAACGEDSGACKHEYDGDCDAICNICGEERETTADHDYSAWTYEGDYHWKVCSVCGAEKPDSQSMHAYGPESGNGQHWEVCECGAELAGSRANHAYVWHSENGQHWKECTCGDVEIEKTAHVYEWKSAGGEHWKECVCGEIDPATQKTAHVYEWKSENGEHWKECACGDVEIEKTAHVYEWHSENGEHWKECVCGDVEIEKTAHVFSTPNHDNENHWDECVCGEKDNVEVHDSDWQSAGGQHWRECTTCGFGKDESLGSHVYEWKIEASQHWKECVCGEADPDTPKAAHSYVLSGGELSCGACGHEGRVEDLTAENGYENGYVYADLSASAFNLTPSADLEGALTGYTVVDANGNAITTAAAGAYVYYAIKSDSSVAYKVNAYVATKVIKSVDDMSAVFFNGEDITGYFILGSDVDYQSNTELLTAYTAGDASSIGGFKATFNGLGYTIKNYVQPMVGATYNLFGLLRNATVENVNFENVTINVWNTSSLLGRNAYGSTIRNITITNAKFVGAPVGQTGANGALLIGWYVGGISGVGSTKFENINISMGTSNTTEGYLHNLFGSGPWEYGNINIITVTNVNVYNVKQGNLNWICGTANDNNAVYNELSGLSIYTDNGNTPYMFVIPGETIADEFITDSDSVVLKSDKFVAGTDYIVNGATYTTQTSGELALPSSILTDGVNTVDVAFVTEGSRVYNGISFTNVIRVTKVIKTVADMDAVYYDGGATSISGYYVLGNDIDYENNTSYVKVFSAGDAAGGFKGIFDGRGYTIRNYTQPEGDSSNRNLFGILRDATIKNVKFENVTIASTRGSLFARNTYSSTLENITIEDAKFTAKSCTYSALLFGWWIDNSTFRNIDITLGTTGETAGYLANIFASGSMGYTTLTSKIENVNVYNVQQVNSIIGTSNNNATVYAAYTGLKIYSDNGQTEYTF